MLPDPWLDCWLPLLHARAGHAPVLEIGCGHGDDTVVLSNARLAVTAFDISPVNVVATALRAPAARIECADVRSPLPRENTPYAAVIASLSLHYFSWSQTTDIVQEIHACLRPGGLLLCRINSTEDRHFGAGKGSRIEENFFLVDGQEKRFFDQDSLARLFDRSWRCLSTTHMTTRKYVRQKALWEIVLEKRD